MNVKKIFFLPARDLMLFTSGSSPAALLFPNWAPSTSMSSTGFPIDVLVLFSASEKLELSLAMIGNNTKTTALKK